LVDAGQLQNRIIQPKCKICSVKKNQQLPFPLPEPNHKILSFLGFEIEQSTGKSVVKMETPTSRKFALQDVAGKGKGLVAVDNIPKGTRILSEKPLISTPNQSEVDELLRTSIRQQINALNEQQRQAFLSMYNIYPYENDEEQYLGIIRTNSYRGTPTQVNGQSSWTHVVSITPVTITRRRIGTRTSSDTQYMH
jgi:hypothetical protein